MVAYTIGCLDVFAPKVQNAIRGVALPEFELRFAKTYQPEEQLDLTVNADFLLVGGAT